MNMKRERLKRYYEAEAAILSGQSYSIEGLSLTRADLGEVQKMIAKLERAIEKEEAYKECRARSRMRYVVPIDGLRVK